MAGGWARDGAVQDQIDASVRDAIDQVRRRIPTGSSLTHCEECGQAIPQARREAVPGVRHCVPCQQQIDAEQQPSRLYNRRGSKDSQLR
ncbi:MAG: DksA/TraR family C4-type zinc finger protein [Gammaproteobacteria bacterium]|nr:DksA/TraR family C4-type zinc finger protein [Gammaproteobacteria bacterium]MDE0281578.1 DksA/TraR family C4-type zinc finger protein [Gammaproteobacteria bacterium]MDE0714445.1 DksA/TraR family C4-type zinc finger protein [Gammaproteobacteria bacterium]MXX17283.1 DksA/TraR family C4-type zinc finger protein [Gammaproteobacteria bacterium]MXY65919.1 DksA/TraR family C4-type zinc finger protein [Gammaproteobacteria bacterium]